MTLGERLKELRNSRRWTLEEVAQKLQLKGHSTYSNWEYNRTQPDAEMLTRIARLYNVSVDYIVNGSIPDNVIDPFIFFDMVDTKTDDEIINEFRHVIQSKDLDEKIVRNHLAHIRLLKSL